jgi:hypothetical protein
MREELQSMRQIKFMGDRRWWTVRAEDERFTILTRQADFKPAGEYFYTIIDRVRAVRGPCNLIGQGWEFKPDTLEQNAAELLRALNYHLEMVADLRPGPRPMTELEVEVSYRNNVPILITAERLIGEAS